MNPFDQQAPIPGIKNIIVIGSGKGGVGKSTVSANVALALKNQGLSVGLLDADIYGPSVPRLFGALNQPPAVNEDKKIIPLQRFGIKLMSMGFLVSENDAMIWRGPMLFKAIDQFFNDVLWGDLDVLIIDLPPGTGDVALTIAQKVPVTGAITVCTPQNMALVDAKRAVDMFDRVNIPVVGVVENMSYFIPPGQEEPVQLFPKGELDTYIESKHIKKIAEIPFNPSVALSSEAGIPTMESHRESNEGKAFAEAAKAISGFLEA